MSVKILVGDVREQLKLLPAECFDCVVTSPPYWGLRDYDVAGQIGLEPTLGEHLAVMIDVFREVRRVIKKQGTLWLNYGDCYAAAPNGKSAAAYKADGTDDRTFRDKPFSTVGAIYQAGHSASRGDVWRTKVSMPPPGRVVAAGFLKPKDLCMVPNRLAIALQDDGWWVRSEIIWHKPNPMPESVYDRPTSAHEKIWLLTRGEDYFYNHEAIREPLTGKAHARKAGPNSRVNRDRVPHTRKLAVPGMRTKNNSSFDAALATNPSETRNARNVWVIAPKAFREAHYATFPPALAERCIKAGVPATTCTLCGEAKSAADCGGICASLPRSPGRVLDPFGGAGTVGLVADRLGLDATLIELNPEYAEMARRRIYGEILPISAE